MNDIDFREEQEEREHQKKLKMVINRVKKEYLKTDKKFEVFHNAHEAYAFLLEEVEELWECVKLNQSHPRRAELMREETIQVIAMAIRFLIDCGNI